MPRPCQTSTNPGPNRPLDLPACVRLLVHPNQTRARREERLLDGLRRRQVPLEFLYEGSRQASLWISLHKACAPSGAQPECLSIYRDSFDTVARAMPASAIQVVSLGCGDGRKDALLVESLRASGKQVVYTPVDSSAAMVNAALRTVGGHQVRTTAAGFAPEDDNTLPAGVVCDLSVPTGLEHPLGWLAPLPRRRVLACFGVLPGLAPGLILPQLSSWLRPGDRLLLSANLVPDEHYPEAVRQVLPQYDNPHTREWLMGSLYRLGFKRGDGRLRWQVEPVPAEPRLLQLTAYFRLVRGRTLHVHRQAIPFARGESLRVFHSIRYSAARLTPYLARHGMRLDRSWTTSSEEEGVFLCRKARNQTQGVSNTR